MAKQNNDNYLTGRLLLAMPQMGDTRFERAVIFICAHDENGAMGLVINQLQPAIKFNHLLEHLGLESDIELLTKAPNIPVMCGGPVEPSRGFLLHSNDFEQDETVSVNDVYRVTGTTDALEEVASGKGPERMIFILGYAGWGANQLEQELQQNAWLVVDPDPEIIFGEDHDVKWLQAVQKLGVDPAMLSGEAGRA